MQDENVYRWEQGGERSWEQVKEDEHGHIITTTHDEHVHKRLRLNRNNRSIRRGLIRYLVVGLDSSVSSAEKDWMPSRLQVCKDLLEKFIYEYYDQNPISQLSFCYTRDRVAEKLTPLSGNSKSHIHKLQNLITKSGSPSLQNLLTRAMSVLKHVPDYGHRECLILYSSLTTIDPSDIHATIRQAVKQKMRVSIICVAAEVYICRKIAEETGGSFSVATDPRHLQELLMAQTIPPPELKNLAPTTTNLVYMGFPSRTFEGFYTNAFEGRKLTLSCDNFVCPRCKTRTTDIPTECQGCFLQLNSSSHIARSHHHLFPVHDFHNISKKQVCKQTNLSVDIPSLDDKSIDSNAPTVQGTEEYDEYASSRRLGSLTSCGGCRRTLKPITSEYGCRGNTGRFECPYCKSIFCTDCDNFIHDELHNCPGCGKGHG